MKLAAFICETRPLPNLIQVINAHLKHLPANTDLFITHGREHRFLKQIYPNAYRTEVNSMSISEYNQLLTSPTFWEQFLGYDFVLVFQIDSMILRSGIEEFMEMGVDYIGSPWTWQHFGFNGGCSLRNPRVMLEVCESYSYNATYQNEDVYFSNMMYHYAIGKLATREQGLKWGTEAVFALNTFCYHAIEKYLTPEQCELIKNQYKDHGI